MPKAVNHVEYGGSTLIDLRNDTVTSAEHIMAGYYGHLADGNRVLGTGQGGGPSATAHSIEFEFSDGTSGTVTAYWNDTAFSDTIRTTRPTTYNSKTIDSASLDGTEWYNRFAFTTVYEGVPLYYTDAGNYLWVADLASTTIELGTVWRITIDDETYVCTAQTSPIGVGIGNPKHSGGDDDGTDVPIFFVNWASNGWSGDTSLPVGEYHVKIEKQL